MAGEGDRDSGRLGRLFAALVGDGDALPDLAATVRPPEADAADAAGGAGGSLAGRNRATTALDVEELSRRLVSSSDPVATLRDYVRDTLARVGVSLAGGADDGGGAGTECAAERELPPSPLELHLAGRLREAGLLEASVALPALHVVRPRTSGSFYLRVDEAMLTDLARTRILRIEAALNMALLVSLLLPDPNGASADALVRAEQRIARSVASQASRVAARLDGPARGEWEVRRALSFGIEAFRLPHRLTARFRVNEAGGAAAVEVDLVPPRLMPATAYVDGLGVVPATADMRRRAATDYNLRVAFMLAGYALEAAPGLSEVWLAGVVDTARGHACYYSVRVTRRALEAVDLDGSFDPVVLMRACGATMDERDRALSPVRQGFSLEDERFCPKRRHDPVELSDRALGDASAAALGCRLVRDLAVDEAAELCHAAGELVRRLSPSTENNVRELLAVAEGARGERLAGEARRCVGALIDGALEDDPLAVVESLVEGDALSVAVERAQTQLGETDNAGAERTLLEALAPVEDAGAYRDEGDLRWRAFASYPDRVVYNRLVAAPGERCELVPAPYFNAHMLLSALALARGDVGEALRHARRTAGLAPTSTQAALHLAHCLMLAGHEGEADSELARLLALAHDPASLGMAYLRMADVRRALGDELAAQACHQRACRHLPLSVIVMEAAASTLTGRPSFVGSPLTEEEERAVLEASGIPLAPTEEVSAAFLEATRAAVDEELFGVARELMETLGAMSRDDVYFGMLRSLEGEPDR